MDYDYDFPYDLRDIIEDYDDMSWLYNGSRKVKRVRYSYPNDVPMYEFSSQTTAVKDDEECESLQQL